MSDERIGCLVIGAGPGGYVAGIRLGQLGVPTVVVERESPGGVCLNWGCIPSKAIIHVAEQVEWLREAAAHGVIAENVSVDAATLQRWKSSVVDRLTGGVSQLLKGNGVDYINGVATFKSATEVEVVSVQGKRILKPEHVILATGARPIQIRGFDYDHPVVMSAREALDLNEIPANLVVVGGGIIGLELGSAYARLGSKVTVIEMTDALLPGTDPDLVRPVERGLKKRGVTIHLKARAEGFSEQKDGSVLVQVTTTKGKEEIPADKILVAVGMRPNTEKLGLKAAGVNTDEHGFIPVNGECRSSQPTVLAIGDVTGGPLLAHRASRMAEVAAEVVAGKKVSMDDVRALPAAIFTSPEIAMVGLSEAEARAAGHELLIGRFSYMANGRALTLGDTSGLVKVLADKESHALLGVGIVGPAASELIGEAALAIEMDATVDDIALTIHTHPSCSEALMEAAKAALGEAVHAINK